MLLLTTGALVAENLEELVTLVDRYTRVAGAVVGLALVAVLLRVLWNRRRQAP